MKNHRVIFIFAVLLIAYAMALEVPLRIFDLKETMLKEEQVSNDVYGLCYEFRDIYNDQPEVVSNDVDGYFELSHKWYNFVTRVYEELSSAPIQEDRERCAMTGVLQVCHAGSRWNPSGNDFFHLASLVPNELEDADYQYFHSHQISSVKTRKFCDAVEIALNTTPYTVSYPTPETLRFTGDYIRLRDIEDEYTKVVQEGKAITALELFALDTIFLDTVIDITSPTKLILTIIAPIWDCIEFSDIPEDKRKSNQDSGWVPRVLVHGGKSGSVIFGIGMKFEHLHGRLTLIIKPDPRTGSQLNIYQLVPETDLQIARTQHGLAFRTPSVYNINNYNYHTAITDYLNYMLNNADSIRMDLSADFLEKIYTTEKFALKMFHMMGFVREVQVLENHFLQLYRAKVELSPIYEGFEKRFAAYSLNPQKDENSVDYTEVRSLINTAIWSKRDILSTDNTLVIKLETYLASSVSDSIKMGDVQKREHGRKIMMYNKDMREGIEREMERVVEFIDNEVLPQMKLMNQRLDMIVQQLLQKIIELKQAVRENLEQRKKDEARLKRVQKAKLFFSILACIGGALLALGTMGGGAFIWIGGASMVLSTTVNAIEDPSITPKIEMPPALNNVKQYVESKADSLTYVQNILDDHEPQHLGDLKTKISKTIDDLKKGVDNAPFVEVEKYMKDKEEQLNKMSPRPQNALNILHNAQEGLKVAQFGSPEMYTQYYRNDTALQILSEAANDNEPEEIRMINEYERNVHALLVPSVQFLNDYSMNIVQSTDSQSLVAIDVSRWKAESLISGVKKQLERQTEGISEGQQIVDVVDRLERAISLVFALLSRGAAYSEYLRLIDYIANVNSIPYQSALSKNAGIAEAVDALKYIVRFNTAITQYKRVLHSYRLFAFPFVTMVIGADNVDLDADRDVIKTTQDLASRAEYQLTYLSLKMTSYKTDIIGVMDVDLMEGPFDGSSPRRPLFYTWHFEASDPLIEKLFNGEAIELFADITKGAAENAIKFNKILLTFKAASAAVQPQLEAALFRYNVMLIHSGESIFQCDDNYYKVNSPNMSVTFSFEKGADGSPTTAGKSYKKLASGDFLLSPYTTWTMQILGRNLSPLTAFKGEKLDLELGGFGQYVSGMSSCESNLENYYDIYTP